MARRFGALCLPVGCCCCSSSAGAPCGGDSGFFLCRRCFCEKQQMAHQLSAESAGGVPLALLFLAAQERCWALAALNSHLHRLLWRPISLDLQSCIELGTANHEGRQIEVTTACTQAGQEHGSRRQQRQAGGAIPCGKLDPALPLAWMPRHLVVPNGTGCRRGAQPNPRCRPPWRQCSANRGDGATGSHDGWLMLTETQPLVE